jgi:hypothetical protein
MQLKDAAAGPTGCLENPLACYLFAINLRDWPGTMGPTECDDVQQ